MPDCRRNRAPGGTFFFTVNLRARRSDLSVAQIYILRDAVRRVRARAPFRIDAWVVLPDHMHCLWTLPQGDADFPGRWRAIKTAFVRCLPTGEPRSPVMTRARSVDIEAPPLSFTPPAGLSRGSMALSASKGQEDVDGRAKPGQGDKKN